MFSKHYISRTAIFMLVIIGSPLFGQPFDQITVRDSFDDSRLVRWNLSAGWEKTTWMDRHVLKGENNSLAELVLGQSFENISLSMTYHLNAGSARMYFKLNTGGGYFIELENHSLCLGKSYAERLYTIKRIEGIHSDAWNTVSVQNIHNTITVYFNKKKVMEFHDEQPITHGYAGLLFYAGEGSQFHIDQIELDITAMPSAANTWIKTGGPSGGLGYDIRIHPTDKDLMFVTDNPSGINKSTDGGLTWQAQNAGITHRYINSLDAIPIFSLTIDPHNPDIIWAGTQEQNKIYLSADGGENWELKNNGITEADNQIAFRGFTVHPTGSDIVYAMAEILNKVGEGGSKGKIYKSTDRGENWVSILETDNLCRFVFIHPENHAIMFASTGIFDAPAFVEDEPIGMLKSTDGGNTWFEINNGIPDRNGYRYFGFLEMHPTNPDILYAASGSTFQGNGGIFKTTDGGASWTTCLEEDNFSVVTVSPSNPDIVYAGSEVRFYRSDDGGENWVTLVKNDETGWGPYGLKTGHAISAVVSPDDPMKVYTNNYRGGAFISYDGGENWMNTSKGYTGATVLSLAVNPQNAAEVYATTNFHVFKTLDGGKHWQGLYYGDFKDAGFCRDLAVHPHHFETVIASDDLYGKLFKSDDGGMNWREVFNHPQAVHGPTGAHGFNDIQFAPSNPDVLYAGMRQEDNPDNPPAPSFGMYKSTDGGDTWFAVNTGLNTSLININCVAVDPDDENRVWIGTWQDGIFTTTDGGKSWALSNNGLGSSDIVSLEIDAAHPNIIFAGTKDMGLYKSIDHGVNWQETGSGIQTLCSHAGMNIGQVVPGIFHQQTLRPIQPSYVRDGNTGISDILIDPTNSDRIMVSDGYSGVYISIDGGENFSALTEGLSFRAIGTLGISSDGKVLYAGSGGSGVFRMAFEKYPPVILGVEPANADTVILQPTEIKRFQVQAYDLDGDSLTYRWSVDDVQWESGSPMSSNQIDILSDELETGFHTLSVHVSDTDTTLVVDWVLNVTSGTGIKDLIPRKFELFANYPNPFNPETTIKINLPDQTHVKVDIFNVLGQSVFTLVDQDLPAGLHQFIWYGKDNTGRIVDAGIYFYRVESVFGSEIRKMMLIK